MGVAQDDNIGAMDGNPSIRRLILALDLALFFAVGVADG